MKKKWSALVLCVCMLISGLWINEAYAMEEWEIQAKDMTELDFHINCCDLSFAMDRDSSYFWSCVTEGLEACTVEPVDMQTDGVGNPVSVFRLCSVCEGTEFLDFSYMNEQGIVKKNLTYKVVVDSNGSMEWTKMAYYSDDVKQAVKDWEIEKDGAIFTFPKESKGAGDVQIADKNIVDLEYYTLAGDYDYNKMEEDWFSEQTQFILLEPKKEGSTTMTVAYCRGVESDTEELKKSYQLVVDKDLHITVIPVETEELEKAAEVITPSPVLTEPLNSGEETRVSELRFRKEKDSECFWICTTKDLKCCTVEKMETKLDVSAIEEIFKVRSICEGTELLNFSYIDKKGIMKKNRTYKMLVDSKGKMTFTRMAFYSKEVKDSVEDWDKVDKSILIFPMEIRVLGNVQIADFGIVDYSDTRFFQKQYYGEEWGFFQPGMEYMLLEPRKEGSTTLTVTYCGKDENEIEMSKMTYQLVVDKELHITIIPMEYIGPGEDLTEGIITKEGNSCGVYSWSYKVADLQIADITDYFPIYHWQDYRDFFWFGGPCTTYYTVKGVSQGTTYICFTYGNVLNHTEDFQYIWYRIDVDEQKHITITEIPCEEVPENVNLPKVTSSPAVTDSYEPENSTPTKVTEETDKKTEGSNSPVVQSEPPKTTVVSTATPEGPVTIMPTAAVENGTIAAGAATNDTIIATNVPEVTKQKTVKVGTVKITSSIRKSVKKAVVKWKALARVKGYQVVLATDKKFTKNVRKRKVSQAKVALSSLRKGKKYYVKVRAYRLDNNGKKIYGQYSDVRVVKKK